METIFKLVKLSERFPNEKDVSPIFLNKIGNIGQRFWWGKFTEEEMLDRFYAFLTVVELPTEDEIYKASKTSSDVTGDFEEEAFQLGAEFIINKLKG